MVEKERLETPTAWATYMLGYMTAVGWRMSKEDAEDFKRAFPEIPEKLVRLAIKKEPIKR